MLRERIASGEWEPREPLPGEALLSRELGVSIGTVRRALDQLARENIVVRERGRGTFVNNDSEWRSDRMFRIRDHYGRSLVPEISLVGQAVAPATELEAELLKLRSTPRFSPPLLRLTREWNVAGRTLCTEQIVVEKNRFPSLCEVMEEQWETLFDVYGRFYRTSVSRVQWSIGDGQKSCILAGCNERQPLDGSTTLFMQRVACDARGVPIELSVLRLVLADYMIEITR